MLPVVNRVLKLFYFELSILLEHRANAYASCKGLSAPYKSILHLHSQYIIQSLVCKLSLGEDILILIQLGSWIACGEGEPNTVIMRNCMCLMQGRSWPGRVRTPPPILGQGHSRVLCKSEEIFGGNRGVPPREVLNYSLSYFYLLEAGLRLLVLL